MPPSFHETWNVYFIFMTGCERTFLFSMKRDLDPVYHPRDLAKAVWSLRKRHRLEEDYLKKVPAFLTANTRACLHEFSANWSGNINQDDIMPLRNFADRWLDELLRKDTSTTHFDLVYLLSIPQPPTPTPLFNSPIEGGGERRGDNLTMWERYGEIWRICLEIVHWRVV